MTSTSTNLVTRLNVEPALHVYHAPPTSNNMLLLWLHCSQFVQLNGHVTPLSLIILHFYIFCCVQLG